MKKYVCTVCGWVYDPQKEILKVESLREQHLKIFQMIGFALFAE